MDFQLLKWLRHNWPENEGLLVILAATGSVSAGFASSFEADLSVRFVITASSLLLALLVWLWARRARRTRAGKVGLAVAVWCEDASGRTVRSDFIRAFRRTVCTGGPSEIFDLVVVPEHYARRVADSQDALRLLRRCNARFLLAASVRRRKMHGTDHEVVRLTAIVGHAPVDDERAGVLAKEFGELLPNRDILIRSDDIYPAVEFTGEWAGHVAQYITALASALSGELAHAETLLNQARKGLSSKASGFPVFAKIRERVPKHLGAIAGVRAREAVKAWYEDKSPEKVRELGQRLTEAQALDKDSVLVLIVSAIHAFVAHRDVKRAQAFLNKIRGPHRDAIWQFNAALLAAYGGDLKTATRRYRDGIRLGIPVADVDVVVGQVEDFLVWLVEQEPHRIEMHYCLGFVNWQIKADSEQALRDFRAFLDGSVGRYPAERELVEGWMDEIRKA
jgi:hypothetical protein